MSYAAIRTYFQLDDGSATPVKTDISHFLDGVTPTSTADELDGTTFQPGVATPTKNIIAGFRNRGLTLAIKWTEAAEAFFSGIEGKNGLNYAFGPTGSDVGMTGVSGLCNCLSYSGPISTIAGVVTATCELRASTRVVGTFATGGAITPLP